MTDFLPHLIAKYNYWAAIILMLIGLYGMISNIERSESGRSVPG